MGAAGTLSEMHNATLRANQDAHTRLSLRGFDSGGVVIGWAVAAWAIRKDGLCAGGQAI